MNSNSRTLNTSERIILAAPGNETAGAESDDEGGARAVDDLTVHVVACEVGAKRVSGTWRSIRGVCRRWTARIQADETLRRIQRNEPVKRRHNDEHPYNTQTHDGNLVGLEPSPGKSPLAHSADPLHSLLCGRRHHRLFCHMNS